MKNDSDVKPVTGEYQEFMLSDLHIQYIPVVTPIKLWKNDMSLKNSPHVELMRIFKHCGNDWSRIQHTRYVQERRRRGEIGLNWDEKRLKIHLSRRHNVLKSIRSKGFKKDMRGEKPVRILEKPIWKTRFNLEEPWLKGYEIWDGGGVCSALYALRYKTVKAIIVEDRYPGTGNKGRYEEKLKNVEGVW